MDQDLIKRFLDKKNVFAVVGASRDRQKYGYQMYRDLRARHTLTHCFCVAWYTLAVLVYAVYLRT